MRHPSEPYSRAEKRQVQFSDEGLVRAARNAGAVTGAFERKAKPPFAARTTNAPLHRRRTRRTRPWNPAARQAGIHATNVHPIAHRSNGSDRRSVHQFQRTEANLRRQPSRLRSETLSGDPPGSTARFESRQNRCPPSPPERSSEARDAKWLMGPLRWPSACNCVKAKSQSNRPSPLP